MIPDSVLDVADRWWVRDFDCAPSELRPGGTVVQEHRGTLVGSTGIWILAVGAHPRVSMPPPAIDLLRDRAAQWTRALVEDPATLADQLRAVAVDRIVGPAFIGYGTEATLKIGQADGARDLTSDDAAAVEALRAACEDEAWDHGGSSHGDVPTFGAFDEGGALGALAGYKTWGGEIAHIAIVSAPHARGRGFGAAAVARAAQHALSAGLLPQYRTLMSNAPSMAIARRLGFQAYGVSVFVRLH